MFFYSKATGWGSKLVRRVGPWMSYLSGGVYPAKLWDGTLKKQDIKGPGIEGLEVRVLTSLHARAQGSENALPSPGLGFRV